MKKSVQSDSLSKMIASLEHKQAKQLELLREQFYVTAESLKPINLVKSSLSALTSSPELKSKLLDNVIGLTTGYLSKKVLVGASHNPVKRILGTLLQFAIANVVSKHTETIKATGEIVLKRIFKNKNESKKATL